MERQQSRRHKSTAGALRAGYSTPDPPILITSETRTAPETREKKSEIGPSIANQTRGETKMQSFLFPGD
jgi:hypothetical protein